jgi:DNA-binding CsgD family transcriptional regulator
LADKEIADKMGVAYNTATTFRQNIENKLGIKSKVGIAVWAIRNGIV